MFPSLQGFEVCTSGHFRLLPTTLTFHLLVVHHHIACASASLASLGPHWHLSYLLGKEAGRQEKHNKDGAAEGAGSRRHYPEQWWRGCSDCATRGCPEAGTLLGGSRYFVPPPNQSLCVAGSLTHSRGPHRFLHADAYHACIDGSKTGGSEEECGAALRLYAAECPRSWVRTPSCCRLAVMYLSDACVVVAVRACVCSTQLLHFEKRRKADQVRSAREAAYQNRQRG